MSQDDDVEKIARFEAALNQLIERVGEDRYVLAIVLVGSLSTETIWQRESLGIWIIEADGVSRRLPSDGNDERVFRILVENGINIHAEVIPRSRFKKMVEGASRTAFSCSFFAHRQIVYSKDASIESWFKKANNIALKDQERELLAFSTWTIHAVRYARKRLEIKGDLELAAQETLGAAHSVAHTEIIRRGDICEQDVIYRAMEGNPKLFKTIYLDVLAKPENRRVLKAALDAIDGYLDKHYEAHLKPLLGYLKKESRVVPLSEMSDHFAFSQLHPWHLESACEWLERKGLLEKISAPFKLTKRSIERVEEPAYFLQANMRTTIEIQGARENNLQNVDVDIPRDKLIVVTGVSGSGKSSLAFDTIYAEGQRRLLASMSTFAKRFVGQLKKPDVDFVNGLSPVVSIDQKTVGSNPRSTVGTMTDISDYLRMLYATLGTPHCPMCGEALAIRTPYQMMEHLLSLPKGTEVEVRAPVYKIHGEDYDYLCEQIRVNGYRRARIDGKPRDLGDHIKLDEEEAYTVEAVIDSFVVGPGIGQQVVTSLEHGLKLGDGLLGFHIVKPKQANAAHKKFYEGFGCAKHRLVAGTMQAFQFTFNDPAGACPTCAGIGTAMRVHPTLLVPDPTRTLNEGAFVNAALGNSPDSWGGRMQYSLAAHYGFSLDTPFQDLAKEHVERLLYGTKGEQFEVVLPPKAKLGQQHVGKKIKFMGIVNQLEHHYRQYRKQGTSNAGMDEYLKKVMVEYDCPECGGARLKRARRLVTIDDRNLHEIGEMHLADLHQFLKSIKPAAKQRVIAETIVREVATRLELLIAIGLDYLSLNRRSATLSGGESQRIRLSSQIGSGLMGMLYVLDEPSIGLHPKDNVKMIETLKRLRDLGNTVIVVEHDADTIRAADHILEIGPGPGVHGGKIVAEGPLKKILKDDGSLTGQYLSGKKSIRSPGERRPACGKSIVVRGARQNNLKNLRVEIPLEQLVCVTGASGSGKSSLIHAIVQKRLYSLLHDSRILAGEHDELTGSEHISDVIDIDQSPIGRSSRSNPATYIGFYDAIRTLFAETEDAKRRDFTASTFSFNVKGGRCEECTGEGTITTQLSFMPDVEVLCPTCKGARYNQDTLEVKFHGKNIAEVLDLSVEEGVEFFTDEPTIARKISVLNELGLGYLKLGHPSTILSGGEAQRVKLAGELGKLKRGKHNLYILDEPTTGLHFADIDRLLQSLNRLVDNGHSVVVIEHNLDVIKTADYVIDLGPEGGHKGGQLIACGAPEEIAKCKASHTGQFLKALL